MQELLTACVFSLLSDAVSDVEMQEHYDEFFEVSGISLEVMGRWWGWKVILNVIIIPAIAEFPQSEKQWQCLGFSQQPFPSLSSNQIHISIMDIHSSALFYIVS